MIQTVVARIVGGLVMNSTLFLTFRLIGSELSGNGIRLDPGVRSPKPIAVWTQLEPLPLAFTNPAAFALGHRRFGPAHAFVYRSVSPAWPTGLVPQALRHSVLVFVLSFVFLEFFTSFNLFGEPPALIGLELVLWAVVACVSSFALVWTTERRRPANRIEPSAGS